MPVRIRPMLLGTLVTLALVPAIALAFKLDLQNLDIGALAKGVTSILSAHNMKPEDEATIGRDLAAHLLGAAPLVDDPELQDYVNRLGRWLALQSERPDLPWTFGVTDDADVNAFAMPGGYVLVTRGLFEILRNEAELAGVLSHEIGHVVAKHHLKALQDQGYMQVIGSVLKATADDDNREMVEFAVNASQDLYVKGLDKKDEYQADRMGVVLASRGGYDPFGLPSALQTLDAISAEDSRLALLFKTHPLPQDRLEHLEQAMGERFDGLPGALGEERFARIQARLRAR
ncbi:MAG: peptidase M48 [Gammaproteobacteria bacterium]|nr:MAG: peptidase M48 [Gammaproteobacteria bacterium]